MLAGGVFDGLGVMGSGGAAGERCENMGSVRAAGVKEQGSGAAVMHMVGGKGRRGCKHE